MASPMSPPAQHQHPCRSRCQARRAFDGLVPSSAPSCSWRTGKMVLPASPSWRTGNRLLPASLSSSEKQRNEFNVWCHMQWKIDPLDRKKKSYSDTQDPIDLQDIKSALAGWSERTVRIYFTTYAHFFMPRNHFFFWKNVTTRWNKTRGTLSECKNKVNPTRELDESRKNLFAKKSKRITK